MDLGDELGPQQRICPSSEQIAAYAGNSDVKERFFHEPSYARQLGFRGLVVPGPMLSAFIEQFLRVQLSEWRLERMSITFRVPTITGERITLRGVVTERHEMPDGARIVCDVMIEHHDGERAVAGTATLRAGDPHSAP